MNDDEDTLGWLGLPTPLQMYRQHCRLLENEVQELNLQLRKARGGCTEGLPADLAGEGMVLQVEKPRGPLDVGECFRPGHFLPFEHLARAERPLELSHELFQVVLHHAVQSHQIAVDVIENLNRRGLGPHEVKRGTAGKNLDVAFMGWKQRNKTICQATFAAHPRDYRCAHK